MNKHVFRLLKALDFGYICKKDYIDFPKTVSSIQFCKLLQLEGIIYFFVEANLKDLDILSMRIFLFSENLVLKNFLFSTGGDSPAVSRKPYSNLTLCSKPAWPSSIKITVLKKNRNIHDIFILSTSLGYLTDKQAIGVGIGGTPICVFTRV